MAQGFERRIARRARKVGAAPTLEQCERLAAYIDLLVTWNRRINLTGLDDPDEVVDRLVLEPVLASRHLAIHARSVIDIGSGGGSPAIPLKVMRPDITLWMVESKTRKSAFLREAVRCLRLDNTIVENRRYEELLALPELHESMDVVTIRAVRVEPATLLNLQAFAKPGGSILLFRGQGPAMNRVPPPLTVIADDPLLPALGSHLLRLSKVPVGVAR